MPHADNPDSSPSRSCDNPRLVRIARPTIFSADSFSLRAAVLDQDLRWRTGQSRALLEHHGLTLHERQKAVTDSGTPGGDPGAHCSGSPA